VSRRKKGKGGKKRWAVGDAVRVRKGTLDPDFPEVPLGGWAGTVRSIKPGHPPIYEVVLTQATLDAMPALYRQLCEAEDVAWDRIFLEGDELEPDSGGPLLLELPSPEAIQLSQMGAEGRVRLALGAPLEGPLPPVSVESLAKYRAHLLDMMPLPYPIILVEANKGPVPRPVLLVRIQPPSATGPALGLRGVIVDIIVGPTHQFEVPLHDLRPDESAPNPWPFMDYLFWLGSAPLVGPDGVERPPLLERETVGTSARKLARVVAGFALAGAGLGAAAGGVIWSASEAGRVAFYVTTAVLAALGLLVGGLAEGKMRAASGKGIGAFAGGTAGAVLGGALGACLGTFAVACLGSVPGAIAGSLLRAALSRLRLPAPGAFVSPFAGAALGAVLYLLLDDWDRAAPGVAWGTGVGLIAGPVAALLVGFAILPIEGEK
jgi:hypothetical protein